MKLPVYSRADLPRAAALVVALLLTAVSTSAIARDFRAADTQSGDHPTVQAPRSIGDLIAERSGGRHQIRVFHSRQLGEEKQTIAQTRAGVIDLNRTNAAPIETFVPAMHVLAMLFLFHSIEHLQKVLSAPIGDEILNSFEPYGFVGLAFYDSGARSIYNSVRPVRPMAEVRGLRLRVRQTELMSDIIKAWGAEPIARAQAKAAGVTIVTDFDRKPFEAAMTAVYAKAQRNPAAAEPIERIRKVE
jgi:TRAP-type C4-dicarboxylate transport system substrate-binding protein